MEHAVIAQSGPLFPRLKLIPSIPQLQGACGLAHAHRQTYIIGYVKHWLERVNSGFHKRLL